MTTRRAGWTLAAVTAAALAAAACGGQQSSGSATGSASALSVQVASTTSDAGTLLCAPAQAQIDACSGLAAGAACTLSSADNTNATTAGTCRATLDGATVACAPNPPAPPQELVDACASLAAGDACTAARPDGDTFGGTCVTVPGGATLVCGRVHTPPQAAIDACASLAAGDACALPDRDGDNMNMNSNATPTHAGVCSLGPAGTGPLACAPAQSMMPGATSACAGLAAGATCTLGREHQVSGTCVQPAAGGDAVCVAACGDLGGAFRCGGHHDGPGMGDHGPGPGPGGGTPPQPLVDACSGKAAGDACQVTGPDGVTRSATCVTAPDGATLLCGIPMMPMPHM